MYVYKIQILFRFVSKECNFGCKVKHLQIENGIFMTVNVMLIQPLSAVIWWAEWCSVEKIVSNGVIKIYITTHRYECSKGRNKITQATG